MLLPSNRLSACLAALVLGLTACGPGAKPPPNDPTGGVDGAEQARVDEGKKKIAEANRAVNAKQYSRARKLLGEASKLGVESQHYEIDELTDKIDKREAKLWANEVSEPLGNKDCLGAFKTLSKQIDELKSETFTRELRKAVSAPAQKCVTAAIDEATQAGKYADARALVGAPETAAVLGAQTHKKVLGELDQTIVEGLKAQLDAEIKAKKWGAAMQKVDDAVKRGDAEESQRTALVAAVREAATPEVQAAADRGLGQRDAAPSLKVLDGFIKTLRWEPMSADTAGLSPDKALPEPLARKREALAVLVETQKQKMKPLKAVEKRWAWGKVSVSPAANLAGESKRDIAAAAEVWVVGVTKDKALIAEKDPGPLPGALDKVLGWASLDRLSKVTTVDWLLPGDQLKGAQVWAPLRPPDKLLELGLVTDVNGKEISVKRLADDTIVKVQRDSVRSGRLEKGQKVLALCKERNQPAVIESVETSGNRGVTLACESGEKKAEAPAGPPQQAGAPARAGPEVARALAQDGLRKRALDERGGKPEVSLTLPPTTYTDLIADVRKQIKTVTLEEIKRRLDAKQPMVLLDVREKEETRAGTIPGAVVVPRGFLEIQVEQKLTDKSAPIVVYCAGGTRSALAAKTLAELGYTNVESANPGFVRWKDLGFPMDVPPQLTDAQRDRYSRHILLPEVGEVGQAKLLKSKVLLLGAGGLGSPAALYLAAAGVGTVGLVDADVVDASNLQRQILHATSRVGMPKVESAEKAIADLNPDVKVVKFEERLMSDNVERIFRDFDVVVDGCDNFPTRYLVNDASVWMKKPVVHGSIFRFEGQVTTFVPFDSKEYGARGPCYRCLYPEPPPPHLAPSCQEAGVLGILPGVVGVIQATEAIKLLLGRGNPLVGRLLTYDSLRMKFGELKLRRDKSCPVCGDAPTIKGYIDYEGFCALPG